MQEHTLRVSEELVIEDHIRLTILAVEKDKVVLGITAEPNGELDPVANQWRDWLTAMPMLLSNDN